ncbi:hypothetical protein V8E52_008086 [Russula decolorans]
MELLCAWQSHRAENMKKVWKRRGGTYGAEEGRVINTRFGLLGIFRRANSLIKIMHTGRPCPHTRQSLDLQAFRLQALRYEDPGRSVCRWTSYPLSWCGVSSAKRGDIGPAQQERLHGLRICLVQLDNSSRGPGRCSRQHDNITSTPGTTNTAHAAWDTLEPRQYNSESMDHIASWRVVILERNATRGLTCVRAMATTCPSPSKSGRHPPHNVLEAVLGALRSHALLSGHNINPELLEHNE